MQPKILLVDDREDNLLSIEAILGSDNYRFVRALSGRQALKVLLQEFDFALILMDVKMPNLNGFETAELIYEREKLRQIPIIFITAHNYGEDSIFKGYQTGAVDYIYKPINPGLLRAKVSVFIELYKKNQTLILQEQKLIAINKNLENEISERKISEEKVRALNLELLKTIDHLEATNKELDRFAFMASHDLQEPLRKIRLFSDRLIVGYEHLLDENGKMYVGRIQNSAERMQALIRDILTFSKVAAEKKVFSKCDLNVIMKEVLILVEDTVKEKKATIVVEELPTIYVNAALMQPLFYNLINNALKYSRKDVTPLVKIKTDKTSIAENTENKSGYCRIYIEDNGIGFEQQYAEQIFSMFTRLHSNSEYDGTGIGLALCKKIVEDHNGFISARSKVDEGSTFIVSLPLDLNMVKPAKTGHTLSPVVS
ncbi:MAG TPA: response regulator [Chitinophagales bacterium]|nr:response regulator [Chitinophagales bacterium]